jgi:hypothetical protein
MQHVLGDIGDKQSALRRLLRGDSKSPSLDLREMFSQSVHLRNRQAGLNKRSIKLGRLFDGDPVIKSFLNHRRRPAADQKKNQATLIAGGKQFQNRLGRIV